MKHVIIDSKGVRGGLTASNELIHYATPEPQRCQEHPLVSRLSVACQPYSCVFVSVVLEIMLAAMAIYDSAGHMIPDRR